MTRDHGTGDGADSWRSSLLEDDALPPALADRLDYLEQRVSELEQDALRGGVWRAGSGKEFDLSDAITWLGHMARSLSDAHARLDEPGKTVTQLGRQDLEQWTAAFTNRHSAPSTSRSSDG